MLLFNFLFFLSTIELLFDQILPPFFRVSIFILFLPCFHLFVFLFSGQIPQLITCLLIELCISVLIHLFPKNYCFVLSEISIFRAYYSYFIVAMFSFYLTIFKCFCFDIFSLDSLSEKAMAPHSRTLASQIPWMEEPGGLQSMGVSKSRTRLSDFTFTFHFHALEKEMGTHSSVLAWRIPGTGEPAGLPSMGSHRVGHD